MKIAYFYRIDKWGTKERFVEEAKELGVELKPIKYEELGVKQEGGDWQVYHKGLALKGFDLYYFRAVGSELEWSKLLTLYAKKEGIPVVDEYLMTHGALRRFKAVSGVMMEEMGVSYPKTEFVGKQEDLISELKNWQLPVVVKISQGGRHGMGTFWVRNEQDMDELTEKAVDKDGKQARGYLVQPYIPNDGDYRLFVVGYKTLGGFKRMPKEEKVVMNKSVGKSVGLDEVPVDVMEEAEKACKALGVEVAGVDLVKDKRDGKVYVIEVNEAPQYKVFEKRTGKNAVKAVCKYLITKGKK
jgi:ribosomal protein S6--L-glutamate ligase